MLTAKERRKFRVRNRILSGLNNKLRLSIFKSNKHFYAQIIDDALSQTILSISTLGKNKAESISKHCSYNNAAAVKRLATDMYSKILTTEINNINNIVFDRGHYAYKGNIRIFVDTMRSLGLNI